MAEHSPLKETELLHHCNQPTMSDVGLLPLPEKRKKNQKKKKSEKQSRKQTLGLLVKSKLPFQPILRRMLVW